MNHVETYQARAAEINFLAGLNVLIVGNGLFAQNLRTKLDHLGANITTHAELTDNDILRKAFAGQVDVLIINTSFHKIAHRPDPRLNPPFIDLVEDVRQIAPHMLVVAAYPDIFVNYNFPALLDRTTGIKLINSTDKLDKQVRVAVDLIAESGFLTNDQKSAAVRFINAAANEIGI